MTSGCALGLAVGPQPITGPLGGVSQSEGTRGLAVGPQPITGPLGGVSRSEGTRGLAVGPQPISSVVTRRLGLGWHVGSPASTRGEAPQPRRERGRRAGRTRGEPCASQQGESSSAGEPRDGFDFGVSAFGVCSWLFA